MIMVAKCLWYLHQTNVPIVSIDTACLMVTDKTNSAEQVKSG
jgi:hypothetical protein